MEVANIAQLAGLDPVRLIGLIVRAASTARSHKKNCKEFSKYSQMIGGLLEPLNISELKSYPETSAPLMQLEDTLRRAYLLVRSCQDRSFPYLLAMGWNSVLQFRRAREEIDDYLKLIPLITLLDIVRSKEKVNSADENRNKIALEEGEIQTITEIELKMLWRIMDMLVAMKTTPPPPEKSSREKRKYELALKRTKMKILWTKEALGG